MQGCGMTGTLDAILSELRQQRRVIDAVPCGRLLIAFAAGRPPSIRLEADVKLLDKVPREE